MVTPASLSDQMSLTQLETHIRALYDHVIDCYTNDYLIDSAMWECDRFNEIYRGVRVYNDDEYHDIETKAYLALGDSCSTDVQVAYSFSEDVVLPEDCTSIVFTISKAFGFSVVRNYEILNAEVQSYQTRANKVQNEVNKLNELIDMLSSMEKAVYDEKEIILLESPENYIFKENNIN